MSEIKYANQCPFCHINEQREAKLEPRKTEPGILEKKTEVYNEESERYETDITYACSLGYDSCSVLEIYSQLKSQSEIIRHLADEGMRID